MRVPSAPLLVACDGGAIEQVLVNLMLNARDALREVGDRAPRVSIDVSEDAPPADAPPTTPSMVRISIRDNGVGMTDEIRRRMFEPFFSTKEGGTGMGMSIVHSFVAMHDGRIEVVTGATGTLIDVGLPRHHR